MSNAQSPPSPPTHPPEFLYHLLRAATERFKCNIPALNEQQRIEAEAVARRSQALEERVLASNEAVDVVLSADQVRQSLDAVAARYDDEQEFHDDLARNGLDADGLTAALGRELRFDAVMQRVGSRHPPVEAHDERLFYDTHQGRFSAPERRSARHILVTINADYLENSRNAARARIDAIARLFATGAAGSDDDPPDPDADAKVRRFGDAARRHSECPTALEDGRIGDVQPGQLYPAVDAALFALAEGAVSPVVESPMGFHLVLCERIKPARTVPLAEARGRIREALEQQRRRAAQRAWLAELGAVRDAPG